MLSDLLSRNKPASLAYWLMLRQFTLEVGFII